MPKIRLNREDSVFKYYQKLIKLRHESELIVYGTYDLILDDDKDIYAYIRTLGDEKTDRILQFQREYT